jgi:hypothetical protein
LDQPLHRPLSEPTGAGQTRSKLPQLRRKNNSSTANRSKPTPNGGKSKSLFDVGAGPATPASHHDLASKSDEPPRFQILTMRAESNLAMIECTRRIPLDPVDEEEATANETEREYQGKLLGICRLPRSRRPAARRAARDWRHMMLAALREKRLRERHAGYLMLRQLRLTRKPAPE